MNASKNVLPLSQKGHKQLDEVQHTISGLRKPGPCPGPALLKGLPDLWLSGIELKGLEENKVQDINHISNSQHRVGLERKLITLLI